MCNDGEQSISCKDSCEINVDCVEFEGYVCEKGVCMFIVVVGEDCLEVLCVDGLFCDADFKICCIFGICCIGDSDCTLGECDDGLMVFKKCNEKMVFCEIDKSQIIDCLFYICNIQGTECFILCEEDIDCEFGYGFVCVGSNKCLFMFGMGEDCSVVFCGGNFSCDFKLKICCSGGECCIFGAKVCALVSCEDDIFFE